MYCAKCGTKADKNSEFCAKCGSSLKGEIITTDNNKVESSGSSFGWGVLGFFIPLVGLILFIVWNKDRKKDAKAAGIGALIGTICYILLYILLFALFFVIAANSGYNGIYY